MSIHNRHRHRKASMRTSDRLKQLFRTIEAVKDDSLSLIFNIHSPIGLLDTDILMNTD